MGSTIELAQGLYEQAAADVDLRIQELVSSNPMMAPMDLQQVFVQDPVLSMKPEDANRVVLAVLQDEKGAAPLLRNESRTARSTSMRRPNLLPPPAAAPAPTPPSPETPLPPVAEPETALQLARTRNDTVHKASVRLSIALGVVVLLLLGATLVAGLVLQKDLITAVFGGTSLAGIAGVIVPIRRMRQATAIATAFEFLERRTKDITADCAKLGSPREVIACKKEAYDLVLAELKTMGSKS